MHFYTVKLSKYIMTVTKILAVQLSGANTAVK